jgi:hypothetical protein
MARREADRALLEEERKAIFLALVQAQDGKVSVTRSRKEVTERFGISDRQLRRIEQEGLDAQWPPLG